MEGLKKKMPELVSSLIREFLGLWSVAIRALESLPKECAWNSIGTRITRNQRPHQCKADKMVEYAQIKLEDYKIHAV